VEKVRRGECDGQSCTAGMHRRRWDAAKSAAKPQAARRAVARGLVNGSTVCRDAAMQVLPMSTRLYQTTRAGGGAPGDKPHGMIVHRKAHPPPNKDLGLQLDVNDLIHTWTRPKPDQQKVVIISGMGGKGKKGLERQFKKERKALGRAAPARSSFRHVVQRILAAANIKRLGSAKAGR
jgi:hypothetical protein